MLSDISGLLDWNSLSEDLALLLSCSRHLLQVLRPGAGANLFPQHTSLVLCKRQLKQNVFDNLWQTMVL